MLDANAPHISLGFVGREALNQPLCLDIEQVSAHPDLKLEELLHKPASLTFGGSDKGSGQGIIHGLVYRIAQGDSGKQLTRYSINLITRHPLHQRPDWSEILSQVSNEQATLENALAAQENA